MKGLFSLLWKKSSRATSKVSLSREYPCHCGHHSPEHILLKKGKEKQYVTLSFNGGKFDYCKECLEAMVHFCPWCTNPIWLGSPVILGVPKEPLQKGFDYYTDPESGLYMFCGRHSSWVGDIAGYYDIPGMINRISYAQGPEGIAPVFEYSHMGRVQIKNSLFVKK